MKELLQILKDHGGFITFDCSNQQFLIQIRTRWFRLPPNADDSDFKSAAIFLEKTLQGFYA